MFSRSPHNVLAIAALSVGVAFALPLAAKVAFAPAASTGSEIVVAPPSPMPLASAPFAIGTDGTNFAIFDRTYGLRAQRVSPAGALLDPIEITMPYQMADSAMYGSVVAVAPSPGGYLVAYGDGEGSLYVGHLTATLAAVESSPVVVAGTQSFVNVQVALARGADGGYLLAWAEATSAAVGDRENAIRALRLDASGYPADSGAPITLGPSANGATMLGPSVVYGGGNYEVVWGENASLRAVHVSEAGGLLDPTPLTIATTIGYSAPCAIATATEDVVAWSDVRGPDGGTGSIYAARVSFDGAVKDTGGVLVAGNAAILGLAYAPSSGVVASWRSETSASTTYSLSTLSESALTLGTPATVDNGAMIASNGSVIVASWASGGGAVASPLSSTGAPTLATPTSFGVAPAANLAPVVATSGSGLLSAWLVVGTGYEIWSRALASDGTPIGQPTKLASLVGSGKALQVVWTGSDYMVLWDIAASTIDPYDQPAMGTYFVRVGADGTPIDATPSALDGNAVSDPPSYSFLGGNGELFAITTGDEVTIARYMENGYRDQSSPIEILFTSAQPVAAWIDATHFELAFVNGATALYGTVVDVSAMTATNPVTIDEEVVAPTSPMIARGQYDTAVAETVYGAIVVYRLDATGAVLGGPYTTGAPTATSGMSLAWDGSRYVLTWGQGVQDSYAFTGYASDLGSDAGAFTMAGALQPFAENLLAPPVIAPLGSGTAIVLGTRDVPLNEVGVDTSIVGVKWTSDAPMPPPPTPIADGGADDASADDASADDAEADDAGDARDASAVSDAGSIAPPRPTADDAGSQESDAGASLDAGTSTGSTSSSGCSCATAGDDGTSGGTMASFGALAAAIAGLARRRRGRGASRRSASTG